MIRAGLTPKLRDTQVLCESLTYGQGAPEVLTGAKAAASHHLACYRPPFRSVPAAGSVGWLAGRWRGAPAARACMQVAEAAPGNPINTRNWLCLQPLCLPAAAPRLCCAVLPCSVGWLQGV